MPMWDSCGRRSSALMVRSRVGSCFESSRNQRLARKLQLSAHRHKELKLFGSETSAAVAGTNFQPFERVPVAREAIEISRLVTGAAEHTDYAAALGDDVVGFDKAVTHGAGRIVGVDARKVVEVVEAAAAI